MQNSVKPMAELFTFKLRNFRSNVNDLRENYWLIFNSSYIYIIEIYLSIGVVTLPGTRGTLRQRLSSKLLLLCSHSPNDVPPEPQRNVSIAAVRGAVRPSVSSKR